MHRLASKTLVLSLLTLGACAADEGPSGLKTRIDPAELQELQRAAAQIDRNGGVFETQFGVEVVVPAGALDDKVTLSVTADWSRGEASYELSPSLTFRAPVDVVLPVPADIYDPVVVIVDPVLGRSDRIHADLDGEFVIVQLEQFDGRSLAVRERVAADTDTQATF